MEKAKKKQRKQVANAKKATTKQRKQQLSDANNNKKRKKLDYDRNKCTERKSQVMTQRFDISCKNCLFCQILFC